MLTRFNNLTDMQKAFPDENACVDHFRRLRWPDASKTVCPKCGVIGTPYTLADNTHKCRDCRKKFTVRNGTIFEDSKIPMRVWFMAIFLMTSHKKGISSCQLGRDIGVTQKTAWFMLHRVRNATMTKDFNGPLTGTVEIDEAYVGPKPWFQHKSKKSGLLGMAAAKEKKIMFGMIQRDGELRLHHVRDTRKTTLMPIVYSNVRQGSRINTDDAAGYHWMRSRYAHSVVKHSLGEYANFDTTTNRIEGVFSHFKRSIVGVYHKASDVHLDRYLQMFAFRWNTRKWTDEDRMNDLLTRTKGRRIGYKTLIGKAD